MRTEKEVRERLAEIEAVVELQVKLGMIDSSFNAFHVALEWVLQPSDEQETEDVDLCDKGAFDYCGDGPPGCKYLCVRRTSEETHQSAPKVKKEEID